MVFWVVTPCNGVVGHQHFRGPCCFYLPGEVKMKAARSSKALVSYHSNIQCHNSEDHTLNLHCHENLSHNLTVLLYCHVCNY